MNALSLIDAWSLWFTGKQIGDQFFLCGDQFFLCKSILWWGRVGKIVSFISAMTIIAEIVGPEKIKAFGKSLHTQFEVKEAVFTIKHCLIWFTNHSLNLMNLSMLIKISQNDIHQINYKNFNLLKHIVVLILTVSLLTLTKVYIPWIEWWMMAIGGVLFYVHSLIILGPLLTFFVIFLIMTSITLFDMIAIKPFAWALANPRIDKLIKVGSLVLLALGFHFDLLAS